MLNLVWFRSDLRVYDQPALNQACLDGPVVAVYFIVEGQWQNHEVSPAKCSFIKGSVLELREMLSRLNIPLLVISVGDFSNLVSRLVTLCAELPVKQVFCNEEYELNESRLTQKAKQALQSKGLSIKVFHDQCLVQPGEVLTQNGDMFKVFSAFKRSMLSNLSITLRDLYDSPRVQDTIAPIDVKDNLSDGQVIWNRHDDWPVGEELAHQRLNEFMEASVIAYAEERDIPSERGTSRLSPYLAAGVLSTRQCLQALMSINYGLIQSEKPGLNTWLNELIWRDFYRHIVYAYPHVCMHKAFVEKTDSLKWNVNADHLDAWKQGLTGYPIVDAGMRELQQTNWMHNRVRMITAMFLSKHLFLDWRLGESHFMKNLIDADFASNNGGWQWSASTGVDAVPYFRIFNPQRQSERFDSEGDYTRRYVPELAGLDRKSIHNPSTEQRKLCGYPEPIVDHASATARTKQIFADLGKLNQPEALNLA